MRLLSFFIVLILSLPFASAQQIDGFHDVYLTHQRICRDCRVTYVHRTLVRLENRAGKRTTLHPHEIIGVDLHPVKRQVVDQFVYNLNPHASLVLFPEETYGAQHQFYGEPLPPHYPYQWFP